ncbi:hypothetical protein ACX64O_26080 [Pseudomonas fitomaticsae]
MKVTNLKSSYTAVNTEDVVNILHEGRLITDLTVIGFDSASNTLIASEKTKPAEVEFYELSKTSLVWEIDIKSFCEEIMAPQPSEILVATPKINGFVAGDWDYGGTGFMGAGQNYPDSPPFEYPDNSHFYPNRPYAVPEWHGYGCKCKTLGINNGCGGFGGYAPGPPHY